MAGEVGFERLAVALDAVREAIPALAQVDGRQVLTVTDPECRRLLEEILIELREMRAGASNDR